MNHFAILLGGELTVTSRLRAQISGARIIAADSGIRHATALRIMPELWVGDFDSASEEDFEAFAGVPRETFPSAKDQTDGELAVEMAIRQGAAKLTILGAFGGIRTDHEFLHLALGVRLAERGLDVTLTSGSQEGRPVRYGAQAFDLAPGTLFSILAFTDLEELSISGAEWPLDRIRMEFGSSLTISNCVTGRLEVSLGSGRALLVAQIGANIPESMS